MQETFISKNICYLPGNVASRLSPLLQTPIESPPIMFTEELISYPNWLVSKSLTFIFKRLEHEVNNLFKMREIPLKKLINIYQNFIFLMISIGDFIYARELCYSFIVFLIQLQQRRSVVDILKFSYMPWLWLICIDRREGHISAGFGKSDLLTKASSASATSGQDLICVLNRDVMLAAEVRTKLQFEILQLHFLNGNFMAAIEYIKTQQITNLFSYYSFLQEANIISHANLGNIEVTYQLISTLKNNHHSHFQTILKLRELEFRIALYKLNYPIDIKKTCLELSLMSSSIKSHAMTSQQIVCVLHLVDLMTVLHMYYQARQLADSAFHSAWKLGDEVLIARSLAVSYALPLAGEERQRIENLMIKYYYLSDYQEVKRILLASFTDLSHVEKKDKASDIISLYEKFRQIPIE